MGAGGGSVRRAARSRRLLSPQLLERWEHHAIFPLAKLCCFPERLGSEETAPGGAGSGGGFAILVQLRTLRCRLCRSRDRTPPRRRYRDRRGSDACRFEERSPSWGDDCCPPRLRGREQHRARQHQHRCRKRRTRSCSSASSVSSSRNERGGAWGPHPSPPPCSSERSG